MHAPRPQLLSLLLIALLLWACGEEEPAAVAGARPGNAQASGDGDGDGDGDGAGNGDGDGDGDGDGSAGTGGDGDGDGDTPACDRLDCMTCADLSCGLNGACTQAADGPPTCECDAGYPLVDGGTTDQTCGPCEDLACMECFDLDCGQGGSCDKPTGEAPACTCDDGHPLLDEGTPEQRCGPCQEPQCMTCEDIDCGDAGSCRKTPGEPPVCECDAGHPLLNAGTASVTCGACAELQCMTCDDIDCGDAGNCGQALGQPPVCECAVGHPLVDEATPAQTCGACEAIECMTCDDIDCGAFGTCAQAEGELPACTCDLGHPLVDAGTPGQSCGECAAIECMTCDDIDCGLNGACAQADGELPACECDLKYTVDLPDTPAQTCTLCVTIDCMTCDDLDCGLNGACTQADMEPPTCECDRGYIVEDGETPEQTCVEDKDCIELDLVDCRARWGGNVGAGIGMQVAVRYCSGTPYVGLSAEQLRFEEFDQGEWEPVKGGGEDYSSVVDRDYVAHLYLLIDISRSVGPERLQHVANGVSALLDELSALPDEIAFAVYLFDGYPQLLEFVPETTDLVQARAMLADLPNEEGLDPVSTDLHGSIIRGVDTISRARELRRITTDRGELSYGTLIIMSDGDDEAGRNTQKDAEDAIKATRSQVITVALGDEGVREALSAFGPAGSYAAPTEEAINQTFSEIAGRFTRFANSLYFVGYCTGKRNGSGNVETRVSIEGIETNMPSCNFSTDNFSSGCGPHVFDPAQACAVDECGGLIGCGGCGDGQCCIAGSCVGESLTPIDGTCPSSLRCEESLVCATTGPSGDRVQQCELAEALGETCGTNALCEDGVTWCYQDPDTRARSCVASTPLGGVCDAMIECETLHCDYLPDGSDPLNRYCLPPPQMYEVCQVGNRVVGQCEPGSSCVGRVCTPQKHTGQTCTKHTDCLSGDCVGDGQVKLCRGASQCFGLDLAR